MRRSMISEAKIGSSRLPAPTFLSIKEMRKILPISVAHPIFRSDHDPVITYLSTRNTLSLRSGSLFRQRPMNISGVS